MAFLLLLSSSLSVYVCKGLLRAYFVPSLSSYRSGQLVEKRTEGKIAGK